MNRSKLGREYELVLLCAQLRVSDIAKYRIRRILTNSIDWNKVVKISSHQGILPFLFQNLSEFNTQNLIPYNIFKIMSSSYYVNLKRNLFVEKEVARILEITNEKSISIIALKGFALIKNLYRNSGLRVMVDVDLLVKEEDIRRVTEIFCGLGYHIITQDLSKQKCQKYQEVKLSSKIFTLRPPLIIELHRYLSAPRPYDIGIPLLWERTQEVIIYNQKIKLLSNEDMFLSLVLHLRQHIRTFNLKFTVDIAELLNITGDTLEWSYIINISKASHIMSTIYFTLYIIGELHNTSIPRKVLNEFLPNIVKVNLIRNLINKHNFLTFNKFRGTLLRLLLFDNLNDFIFYLWKVSFLERFTKRIITAVKEKTRRKAEK